MDTEKGDKSEESDVSYMLRPSQIRRPTYQVPASKDENNDLGESNYAKKKSQQIKSQFSVLEGRIVERKASPNRIQTIPDEGIQSLEQKIGLGDNEDCIYGGVNRFHLSQETTQKIVGMGFMRPSAQDSNVRFETRRTFSGKELTFKMLEQESGAKIQSSTNNKEKFLQDPNSFDFEKYKGGNRKEYDASFMNSGNPRNVQEVFTIQIHAPPPDSFKVNSKPIADINESIDMPATASNVTPPRMVSQTVMSAISHIVKDKRSFLAIQDAVAVRFKTQRKEKAAIQRGHLTIKKEEGQTKSKFTSMRRPATVGAEILGPAIKQTQKFNQTREISNRDQFEDENSQINMKQIRIDFDEPVAQTSIKLSSRVSHSVKQNKRESVRDTPPQVSVSNLDKNSKRDAYSSQGSNFSEQDQKASSLRVIHKKNLQKKVRNTIQNNKKNQEVSNSWISSNRDGLESNPMTSRKGLDKLVDQSSSFEPSLSPFTGNSKREQGSANHGRRSSMREQVDFSNTLEQSHKKLLDINDDDDSQLKVDITETLSQGLKSKSELKFTEGCDKKLSSSSASTAIQTNMKAFMQKSLYIFRRDSKFRILCGQIILSRYFDYFMLFCVFANCLTLTLSDYEFTLNSNNTQESLSIIEAINMMFTVIYFFEFLFCVVFQGFAKHKRAYLKNGWNYLDIVIIIIGFVEIGFWQTTLKPLRALRVICRPLKMIKYISNMRVLVQSLIDSLPDFVNVGIFMVFIFVLFATMGLQQYDGAFFNTCRYSPTPDLENNVWPSDLSFNKPCSQTGLGNFECPGTETCGNIQDYPSIPISSEHYELRQYISYGIINFNNLGNSLLSVFQMITSETFYQQQFNMMNVDISVIGVLFSISVIIVGQFFLLNLILAVIINSFMKSREKKLEEEVKMMENQSGYSSSNMVESEYEEGTVQEWGNGKRRTKEEYEEEDLLEEDNLTEEEAADFEVPKVESEEDILNDLDILQFQENLIEVKQQYTRSRTFQQKSILINKDVGSSQQQPMTFKRSQTRKKEFAVKTKNNQSVTLQVPQKEGGLARGNTKRSTKSKNMMKSKSSFHMSVGKSSKRLKKKKSINPHVIKVDAKLQQEEEQYNQNNDFTAFLRTHAQKRKVANIFMKMQKQVNKEEAEEKMKEVQVENQQPEDQVQNEENDEEIEEEEKLRSDDEAQDSLIYENPLGEQAQSMGYIKPVQYPSRLYEGNKFSLTGGQPKNFNQSTSIMISGKVKEMRRKGTLNDTLKKMSMPLSHDKGRRKKKKSLSPNRTKSFGLANSNNGGGSISKRETFATKPTNVMSQKEKKMSLGDSPDFQQNVLRGKELLKLLGKTLNFQVNKRLLQIQELKDNQQQAADERIKNSNCVRIVFQIQQSPLFSAFLLFAIMGNIVVLCLDSYPVNLNLLLQSEIWNILFTIIYSIEMLFNLLSFGFKNYFKSSMFNMFDCLIVMVSTIDVLTASVLLSEDMIVNSYAITILRSFRAIRMFKLAKYWRNFQVLLSTLFMTMINISTFMNFLFLIMFIYTLLGLEFFANLAKINEATGEVDPVNGQTPMFNFDTFLSSFTTVFVVLTNDGQSVIYYIYYRAVSGMKATIWWISYVVLVQKILVNVFLAILLQNYDEGTLKHKIIQNEQVHIEESVSLSGAFKEFMQRAWNSLQARFNRPEESEDPFNSKKTLENTIENFKKQKSLARSKSVVSAKTVSSNQEQIIIKKEYQGKSMGFISENSKLREILHIILSHDYYRNFVVLVILMSSTQLALDSQNVDPNSTLQTALQWMDITVILIFTIEMIAKFITYGLLFSGENSYFRGTWNQIDFVILIFSYLCLTPMVSSFKVVKALRILRSLRLISRNEGLKVAVRALFFAIPNVINITMTMLLFFLIFAVISVSYFKGKLYYCVNTFLEDTEVQSKWDCLNMGGLWVNRTYNYDNIINAMVNLFVMATTAGWSETMMYTVSSNDIDYIYDLQDVSPTWIVFFLLFMIIGFFFFLNLFIGVVINTFNSEQMRVGGSELLTDKQKEWIDLRLLVLRSAPIKKLKPPTNKIRFFFYRIHNYKHFEKIIQLSIISNTIVLMVKWYRQPPEVDQITEYFNYFFTVIFLGEATIRLLAIGIIPYFIDGWNIFDFIVAIGSLAGILISLNTQVQFKATTLLRAFRILRLLRLLKRGGKSLYLIFNTFVITMQSLANIGGLLILIMYIYSIIGMIYMGDIMRTGTMNDYINFETFTNAFITLFIVSTEDSWNFIMASFANDRSPSYDCLYNPTYEDYQNNGYQTIGCGSVAFAFTFFVSFMFIVSLVFLKLFIAIILQGYLQTQTQENRMFNNDIREKFREVWSQFDPDATCFIKLSDIRTFLFALGAPLGFDESYEESRFMQDRFIASLELPTYHRFQSYQFLDLLDALSFRLMVIDHIVQNQEEEQEEDDDNNNQSVDERTVKTKIEKEVNCLIFQKQSENIVAFKELWEKEQKKKRNREKNKDQTGLTSSHHMALEAAIRRIKVILANKRKAREEERLRLLKEEQERNGIVVEEESKDLDIQSSHQSSQKPPPAPENFFQRITRKFQTVTSVVKSIQRTPSQKSNFNSQLSVVTHKQYDRPPSVLIKHD